MPHNKFLPWLSPVQIKQISWLIRSHDLFGRLARGLSEKVDLPEKGINVHSDITNIDPCSNSSYPAAVDPIYIIERILDKRLLLGDGEEINNENNNYDEILLDLDFDTSVNLLYCMWCADIGSIASVRWLLPLANLLKKFLISFKEGDMQYNNKYEK